MEDRYSRNIPALSPEECILLKQKRVLVVGCGGIGGHLLDLLLRVGVGTIRICDGDVFEPSNLNRQLLADVFHVGEPKVRIAGDHARKVNPDVVLEMCNTAMTEGNVADMVASCDVVLDALDNIESRKILCRACSQAGIPYIFGAVSGWVAQAAVCMPGEHLLDTLYPAGVQTGDKSVLSFTPALCASVQAALCIKFLTGRGVQAGKLYHFDLLNQEFDTISLL